ncbi:hypothetical protein [Streptomyces sp. NPDC049040]|uniref:hypothetical protein n=1 Tax=Streptomyces sp. NPDC049040 TaxID=3365593 RepID=UPI00370FD375
MASHQPARESGDRLRLIAAASVAALAVVLPLAAATGGGPHDGAQHGNAGHSASHRPATGPADGD